MTLKEIRNIAKNRGIKPGKLNKKNLIRSIQIQEGNFDCFGTATLRLCDQLNCMWRRDCLGRSNEAAKPG